MLSSKFKLPGYIMVITGMVLAVLYFTVKFRFEIPVFALVSSYLKTSYFTTFSTNFSDETVFILLLAGFSLVVFSREKDELEIYKNLRFKAMVKTVITDVAFMIFCAVFIYGAGFPVVVLLNVILPFIIYLGYFNLLKMKEIKSSRSSDSVK